MEGLAPRDWYARQLKGIVTNTSSHTNWVVITGGPCSGKTTIINKLKNLGFDVVHEVGRSVINQKIKDGYKIELLHSNQLELQREIIKRMYETEFALDKTKKIYLDRAVPDGIGFYLYNKLDMKELLIICKSFLYNKVFLLEQIPREYVDYDHIRIYDYENSVYLERKIEEGYRMLNYSIIKIPFTSVQNRLELILESTK
jgi:predicted ATPase